MDADVRDLLLECDDPVGFEIPQNDWHAFPFEELAASVGAIRQELSDLGFRFERDGNVQDASFHDELHILEREPRLANGTRVLHAEVALRFSNFGRLYTLCGSATADSSKYPLNRIRAVVEKHGWRHVPSAALDEIYDGPNDALRDGKNTWWVRFFEYL